MLVLKLGFCLSYFQPCFQLPLASDKISHSAATASHYGPHTAPCFWKASPRPMSSHLETGWRIGPSLLCLGGTGAMWYAWVCRPGLLCLLGRVISYLSYKHRNLIPFLGSCSLQIYSDKCECSQPFFFFLHQFWEMKPCRHTKRSPLHADSMPGWYWKRGAYGRLSSQAAFVLWSKTLPLRD